MTYNSVTTTIKTYEATYTKGKKHMILRFQKLRNIHRWMETSMKTRWIAMKVHNVSKIYNIICGTNNMNNNNK
jgi:antibiotic biosynthesis monooxygenase (ABM) superfamily enzyme